MSALTDFIDRHRSWPWPTLDENGASAKELYEAYMAEVGEDRRVMTTNEWSPAIIEAGFTRGRIAGGYVYYGLTVKTREARARGGAVSRLFERRYNRSIAEHVASKHDGNRWACHHGPPPNEVGERLYDEAEADEAGVSAIVERDYGPYLRWRPGEPHPGIAIKRAEDEAERAKVAAQIEAMEATPVGRYMEASRERDLGILRNRLLRLDQDLDPVYQERIRREVFGMHAQSDQSEKPDQSEEW